MAAQKEYLLSLGHLTGTEKNTFTKQREHYFKTSVDRPMELQANFSTLQSHQHLRVMCLQQQWLQLKQREHAAQQHNRLLLQQFEQAQETLKEMLARNAAMKTIRVEYERYLEESAPRWQQQLKEKTQAAQKKRRMEDYLRSHLNHVEEGQVTKSSANQPLPPQGPDTRSQKSTAPQPYANYNQDGSSYLSYPQSSWLTHSQSPAGRFPIRAPYQPHSSSPAPQSFHPTPIFPHPFPLHHLTSTPGPHYDHHGPRQDPAGWASMHSDYPRLWAAEIPPDSNALWGQLYVEEPPPGSRASQTVVEEDSMHSKRERSHLSQELDIKPVRLTGGHTESSKSSRDSSLASREKRDNRGKREGRGRPQHTSSDEERCTSEGTSSEIVIPSGRVTKSTESEASSEKGCSSSKKTRSEGFTILSPQSEKVAKKKSKRDDSESERHAAEELGSSSEESMSEKLVNDSKSEICGAESGSQREDESGRGSTKNEHGAADEIEEEESSSTEEEERRKHVGAGEDEEKENSKKDEEQDRNMEHDDDEKKITEEEEEVATEDETEDQGDDEEQSDKLHDKVLRGQDSSSSEDEEVNEDASKGSEEETEEGESEEEEPHGSDEAEDRDSDDSIISPQEKRSKLMQVIPEEANEDEGDDEEQEKKQEDEGEEEEEGSSEDSSNEFNADDNIEDLLAPQEQNKTEEKHLKANEKPKALCDNMQIFQVTQDGWKTDQPSDSDEFDHFYD